MSVFRDPTDSGRKLAGVVAWGATEPTRSSDEVLHG
jgi:hypothetical protein